MLSLVRLSCEILLYGPYCIVGLAAWRRSPQLLLVFLLSIVWAYVFVYVITALLFSSIPPLTVRPLFCWCTGNTMDEHWMAGRIVFLWVFQNIAQYTSRSFLFFLLLRVNSYLRFDQQLLHYCHFRFAAVSASVGLGFAAASLLLTSAPLLDTEKQLTSSWKSSSDFLLVTGYDLHICPQLPIVVHRSLQSFLYSIAHVVWSIVHGLSFAALYGKGLDRVQQEVQLFYRRAEQGDSEPILHTARNVLERLSRNAAIPDSFLDEDVKEGLGLPFHREPDEMGSRSGWIGQVTPLGNLERPIEESEASCSVPLQPGREVTPPSSRRSSVASLQEESDILLNESFRCEDSEQMSLPERAATEPTGKQVSPERVRRRVKSFLPLPKDSALQEQHSTLLIMALFVTFILQLLFTGITLRISHSEHVHGSYSCDSHTISSNHGCAWSLPLQAVVTTFSTVLAVLVTPMEFCSLLSIDNITQFSLPVRRRFEE